MPETVQLTAARGSWLSVVRGVVQPFVLLLVVVAIFQVFHWLAKPEQSFLKQNRLETIAKQTAIVGVGALGMTLVIISGGIDLSVGSLLALSSVVMALLLKIEPPAWLGEGPELPTLWCLLIVGGVLLTGGTAGAVNGLLVTRLKLVPFIATLGTMLAFRGLAEWLADQKKVVVPGERVPEWLSTLVDSPDNPLQVFCTAVWIVIVCAAVMAFVLRYTIFGRYVFAVGSNEAAARLCGIQVNLVRVAVYALGGLFMAIAGIFDFNDQYLQGNPSTGRAIELDIIAAVVIGGGSLSGGRGSILGALVGALAMTTLQSGCDYAEISECVQKMVIGTIILAAVALDQRSRRA